jgi:hypothetical protein
VLNASVSVHMRRGELFIDMPFQPDLTTALVVIGVPSLVNCLTWSDPTPS